MEFFKNIKNSVYGPVYYQSLLTKSFSSTMGYFVLLSLAATILGTAVISFTILPKILDFLKAVPAQVMAHYPGDLEVKIKNGIVSTNVEEPYFVKYSDPDTQSPVENILVIDTKSELSVGKFTEYKTMALLTRDSLIYADSGGKISIVPLTDVSDLTINRQAVAGVLDQAASYLKYFYPVAVPVIFVFYFFGLLFRMVYMLFAALLVWLVVKIKNLNIGYWKSYQLGIHLMTLPILIGVTQLTGFPLLFTAILVIMAAVNLKAAVPVSGSVDPVSNVPAV